MGQVSRVVYRPGVMFGLGALVTLISMSVSLSLSVLVPLSDRGLGDYEQPEPGSVPGCHAPVASRSIAADGHGLGLHQVLSKPFGKKEFLRVIQQAIESSGPNGISWEVQSMYQRILLPMDGSGMGQTL